MCWNECAFPVHTCSFASCAPKLRCDFQLPLCQCAATQLARFPFHDLENTEAKRCTHCVALCRPRRTSSLHKNFHQSASAQCSWPTLSKSTVGPVRQLLLKRTDHILSSPSPVNLVRAMNCVKTTHHTRAAQSLTARAGRLIFLMESHDDLGAATILDMRGWSWKLPHLMAASLPSK